MPEYLVLLLVQVTIFSSVTAVLLLAVKWLFRRRIPPMLSLILWLILLVRVTIPVLPESALSIYNLIPAGREIQFSLTYDNTSDSTAGDDLASAENPYKFSTQETEDSAITGLEAEESALTDAALQAERLRNRESLRHMFCIAVLMFFFGGMLLTAAVQVWLYIHAIHRVYRQSAPCRDPELLQIYTETAAGLRIMDKKAPPLRLGSSTMLAGMLQPCVILCAENISASEERISPAELRMIFLHELNHFKYRDNWILLLSTLVCTIFWYNPLLWLVRNILREDIEVLCDARTLETCGIQEQEYARMLCRSSHLPVTAPEAGVAMSASGRKLKLRLQHISSRRKGMFLPRILSLVLCSAMIALCLTNPMVAAESAYTPYIERIAAMTGRSVRDLTLAEQMTVQEFLELLDGMFAYEADPYLQWKMGGGDFASFVQLAEESSFVSEQITDAVRHMEPEDTLTLENCAILLSCTAGLLGEGRFCEAKEILPEMLSQNTMEALCRNLTKEEAALLQSCYNVGVEGAQVEFSYIYTEAMMKLILSRIQGTWFREKLSGYYQKVNLSGDKLNKVTAYLNNTVRFVGIGRDFYICDPALSRVEEEFLRGILGAAYAGEREDIYYLKKTEDGCSFEKAAELISKAGMTGEEMYAEYAQLGVTAYTDTPVSAFLDENGSVRTTEAQLDAYAARFPEDQYLPALLEMLIYHDAESQENVYQDPFLRRHYTADPENVQECRKLVFAMCSRMNAAAFTMQYHYDSVEITDMMSPAAEEACLLAANLGVIHFSRHPVSVQRQLTGGQCARILCRFLASITNAN